GSLCFSATCSFLPSLFHALLLPSCPTRRSSDLGLALNRHMDMSPFLGINPCGYAEQPMTSLQLEGLNPSRSQVEQALVQALQEQLALTQNTLIFETLPAHPLNEAATMSASPSHVTEELS